jgi:hypothetical protein
MHHASFRDNDERISGWYYYVLSWSNSVGER